MRAAISPYPADQALPLATPQPECEAGVMSMNPGRMTKQIALMKDCEMRSSCHDLPEGKGQIDKHVKNTLEKFYRERC